MGLKGVKISFTRDSSNSSMCDVDLVSEMTTRSVGHLKEEL
jgi:hypothetical protein